MPADHLASDRSSKAPSALEDLNLAGLLLLAEFHGLAADASQLTHLLGDSGRCFNEASLVQAAKILGLKAKVVAQPLARMDLVALPVLSISANDDAFIIARVSDSGALIHDLREGRPKHLSQVELEDRYSGRILLVSSRASISGSLAKFDFSWFIPSIVRYRKPLLEVVVVSLFVQLFALATPLFYQVVMDKVLVHRAFTTLDLIAIGLVAMALFDVVLSGLRTLVFSHTASKIDVELGTRLFRHLVSLPLAYFEARRAGDTVARVRELENIRSFMTGQALTSLLDLVFTGAFLALMFYYSPKLTLIVMVSLPAYALVSAGLTPLLRRRLDRKFARGADNQAFLVETINGIGTVKAGALEPRAIRTWDAQLAGYVSASLNVTRLATLGQQGVQVIQKLAAVAILFWGAKLVISGKLTVGQLIAFNMLAGQVAAPIVRIAQLWQDFQQVGVSVERLGDVLNSPPEMARARVSLPEIAGQITFEDVLFRYRPDVAPALNGISIDILPGEVIGIVGRSGSGKSTLTKIIQRLYVPERGRVLVDGHDLSLIDPAWLRRQLGVVLQENFLFNRTIRENIAISDPGMALSRVIDVAKLAGAHEFIVALPEAYDTMLGENGAGLSGGQRQRIAIARALVTDPRILIFDEATSALDYESEAAVMANMQQICAGRTVIIIAHRLSTVRGANKIVVLDRGSVIEEGSHADLLAAGGAYAALSRLQQ